MKNLYINIINSAFMGWIRDLSILGLLAAIAEHVLPALLIIGFLTRISAAGLLVMTAVIQLFVFPDAWWSTHMFWAAIAFAIIGVGPGRLSVDHLLTRNSS